MSERHDTPVPATPGLRRYWPAVVPVVWAAAVLALMQPGALAGREEVPFAARWLVYDPTDFGAFVLRGANAATGRLPGRADEPPWAEPPELAARLAGPPLAYSERYYLEYPTAALVVFRLGFPTRPDVPAAVADSHHYAVAHFAPRTDAERKLWADFHAAAVVYVLVMAAGLVGLILVLARGYEPGRPPGPVWLAVLPGAVYFGLNRFDVLPALATALGFACLGRDRRAWAGAWMAVGVLLKVYPVVFVPVVLRYLGPARGGRWLAGFALTLLAGFGLSVAAVGWEGTVAPIRVQLSRPLEIRWTFYGRLLPVELGHAGAARLAILAAVVLAASATRPADLGAVLRRCALILAAFAVLAVFWSPQWVLWFLPLLVPLAERDRRVLVCAVGLDLVNYFSFPILFWLLAGPLTPAAWEGLMAATVYARAAIWVALAAALLRQGWAARHPDNPR
jgi:hypothetical protein